MQRPTPEQWQDFLHREIPVTHAQAIEVARLDADGVALSASLAANHNDKGTGFAGSLFSVAVLTGWSQVMLLLRDADLSGQVVVSESRVRYLQPANADFRAVVNQPDEEAVQGFYRQLEKKGRARLPLTIDVMADGQRVLSFEGQYAALLTG